MQQHATFVFLGRLESESFAAFVRHRVERLSLRAGGATAAPGRFEVSVAGAPDLIDAFEMACSLGPIDCLVLDTLRHTSAAEAAS